MIPIKVEIADFIPPVDASTLGRTWNGWECPYFTHAQAEALAMAWREAMGDDASAWYDADADRWCFWSTSVEETDSFPASTIDGVTCYPVGAFCWVWSRVCLG